jgi:hypothetical protein
MYHDRMNVHESLAAMVPSPALHDPTLCFHRKATASEKPQPSFRLDTASAATPVEPVSPFKLDKAV